MNFISDSCETSFLDGISQMTGGFQNDVRIRFQCFSKDDQTRGSNLYSFEKHVQDQYQERIVHDTSSWSRPSEFTIICKVGESKQNVSSTLCAKRQRPLWGRCVLSVSRDFLGMLAHQAYCCVSEGWGPYNCVQFLWQIGLGFCRARSKPVCIYGFGLPCKTDRRREFW